MRLDEDQLISVFNQTLTIPVLDSVKIGIYLNNECVYLNASMLRNLVAGWVCGVISHIECWKCSKSDYGGVHCQFCRFR